MSVRWSTSPLLSHASGDMYCGVPSSTPAAVLTAVAAENRVFHGPLAPSTVNSYLYKVLGCAEPPSPRTSVGLRPS